MSNSMEQQINTQDKLAGAAKELLARFGADCSYQESVDDIPNIWVRKNRLLEVMTFLKNEISQPFPLLFDLSAIDERQRKNRQDMPDSDFTTFYHLISLDRNEDLRIKVASSEEDTAVPSICSLWPSANWY